MQNNFIQSYDFRDILCFFAGISCILMTACGEGVSFLCRFRKRQREIQPSAISCDMDPSGSYLHRNER